MGNPGNLWTKPAIAQAQCANGAFSGLRQHLRADDHDHGVATLALVPGPSTPAFPFDRADVTLPRGAKQMNQGRHHRRSGDRGFCHRPEGKPRGSLQGHPPPRENPGQHSTPDRGATDPEPRERLSLTAPAASLQRGRTACQRRQQDPRACRIVGTHDQAVSAIDGQRDRVEITHGHEAIRRKTRLPFRGGMNERKKWRHEASPRCNVSRRYVSSKMRGSGRKNATG